MKKLFIATPVYGQLCPFYSLSMTATTQLLQRNEIAVVHSILSGCCYLDIARNKLVRSFLASEADEMVFVDADVSWDPYDFLRLVNHKLDFIGAVAPFRGGGGFPVKLMDTIPNNVGLYETHMLPTTMLKLTRNVFDTIKDKGLAPLRIEYEFDGKERERYDQYLAFVENNDEHITYREDVVLSFKWRHVGGRTWLDPDFTMKHWEYTFTEGNFASFMTQQSKAAA